MAELETRFSGDVPENYDRALGPFIFEHYAQEMADRCAALNPNAVLETAAGTGIVTNWLRQRISPDASLTSTDLNMPMLAHAEERLEQASAIKIMAADACDLPFEDSQFDAVVCQFGIMFFPDKATSYAEALRVLKPGGTYLFSVWNDWSENPFAQVANNVAIEFCADDPPQFYKVPFGYNDADAIHGALDLAGFDNSSHEVLSHIQPLFDIDLFAHGLVYGNPLEAELLERGVDPEKVRDRMAQALREHLGETMPLSATIFSATKA